MHKKLVTIFFIFLALFSSSIIIIILIIDPLQQYRQTQQFRPMYKNANYLLPGIVKNYNYDSIILGSSHTENFILSDLSQLPGFDKPIKLTLKGAYAHNIKIISDLAFKHQKINAVLLGLDIYALSGDKEKTTNGKEAIPFYLYDDNPFNDYKYIFNIDTLIECLRPYLIERNSLILNYDTMFVADITTDYYSSSLALNSYISKHNNPPPKEVNNEKKLEYFKTSFLYNILPMIKEHPETEFKIFYPPYSILSYKLKGEEGWLKDYFKIKIYIFNILKNYENVELYDFQSHQTLTHNLNNYYDKGHYHYKINKWILKQIKDNNFLVTENNINIFNKSLIGQTNSFVIPNI